MNLKLQKTKTQEKKQQHFNLIPGQRGQPCFKHAPKARTKVGNCDEWMKQDIYPFWQQSGMLTN